MADNATVPRSMREGKGYIDGELVIDLMKAEINFTPDVAEKRALGERGKTRRWLGFDVTGSITAYRTTPLFKKMVKSYLNSGKTPLFTFVGKQDDPEADYDQNYGKDVITVEKAVITGDINLLSLDTEGEYVQDEIEFGGKNVIVAYGR